mmetsp:Transcript_33413/g.34048  ORF Transcript_33413/g.34048 Transcript_33413/m.34048 type:complete len:565 (-) Transcript_33413:73-1767(-)
MMKDVHDIQYSLSDKYSLLGTSIIDEHLTTKVMAFDKKSKSHVIIKHVLNVDEDGDRAKGIVREVMLLHGLRSRYTILLKDVYAMDRSVNLVTDSYEKTLKDVIYPSRHSQICRTYLLQNRWDFLRTVKDILHALNYIHEMGVIHRDIRPESIIVGSKLEFKIQNFEHAIIPLIDNSFDMSNPSEWTPTLSYSAPEVLCNQAVVSKAQDVWAMACVFAELMKPSQLFPCSDSYNKSSLIARVSKSSGSTEIIKSIINILGAPTSCDLDFDISIDQKHYLSSFKSKSIGLHKIIPNMQVIHPNLCNAMHQMLQFNPNLRATAESILSLPFIDKTPSKQCEDQTRDEINKSEGDLCDIKRFVEVINPYMTRKQRHRAIHTAVAHVRNDLRQLNRELDQNENEKISVTKKGLSLKKISNKDIDSDRADETVIWAPVSTHFNPENVNSDERHGDSDTESSTTPRSDKESISDHDKNSSTKVLYNIRKSSNDMTSVFLRDKSKSSILSSPTCKEKKSIPSKGSSTISTPASKAWNALRGIVRYKIGENKQRKKTDEVRRISNDVILFTI